MKKLTLLIFLLSVSLFSFSCKKERIIHITAKNAVTGKPYPGLPYEIIQEWSGPFENKYKTAGFGYLNENGEVFFKKRLPKNRFYSIIVGEPDNCCYNKNIYLYPGSDLHFKATFEFAECAYLQQNIKNVNCEGSNDVFIIRDRYSYTDWTGWSELKGCFSNVGGGYSKVPAGKRYFQWEVIRNGVVTYGQDTVNLIPGEQEEIIIHY